MRPSFFPSQRAFKLAAFSLAAIIVLSHLSSRTWGEEPFPVTAIDILLLPDQTMLDRATAINSQLRQAFPEGFSLDETHHPHVTCLQRYVRTADLDQVYAAVEKTLAEERPATWKLTAHKYYYLPWKPLALAGIVVEPTEDLLRFQRKLIDAVTPYTVPSGTAAAYVTTKESPDVNQDTIEYVATYLPLQVGPKFNPHVTIGLASEAYLQRLQQQPFDTFTFSPVGVAVYHLGNFGTARTRLKSWDLQP